MQDDVYIGTFTVDKLNPLSLINNFLFEIKFINNKPMIDVSAFDVSTYYS